MLSSVQKTKLKEILKDDAGKGDVTGSLVPKKKVVAEIVAEDSCVLAGVEEAAFILQSSGLKTKILKKDGQRSNHYDKVIRVSGSNHALYKAERAALNVLSRMSGVATICAKAAKIARKASSGKTQVSVTRKTLPGFNEFDKKAAGLGSALPHRKNLSDKVLFKSNHLKYLSIPNAVKHSKKRFPRLEVEVEVESPKEVQEAATAMPTTIMLDNMKIEQAKKAIQEIRKTNRESKIEISGGVSFENLSKYAKLKPDVISMGLLTNSAPSKSFGMELVKNG
ncbi:MAG: carboxylating nicotinate-nucleotide diphosphorylase [Candidatus Micrarchaeia archaeon]